jgi:hypothetical protein
MARRFQNGDKIVFPIPAALQVDGGPLTIYTRSSSAHAWWCEYDTTGGLHFNYGTGTTARPIGSVSTGAWVINTARKDNAGSVKPIGRHLTGASFATDSGDVEAASTLIDGTAADGSLGVQFGLWGTSTDDSDDLELAFAAVWTSVVAGATLATLTTEALVLAASPTYWASFEGSGTPTDSEGGSPTVTNTTTTSDPSGFFGGADATATPSTVAAVGAVPAPTLSTGSVVTLGGPVAAVGAVPAPTVALGVAITPDSVATVGAVPAATVATGSTVTLSADVAAVGAVPTPTLSTGSTVTLSADVTAATAVPTPTVVAGGNATVAPDSVAAVAAALTPTLSTGSMVTLGGPVVAVTAVLSPAVFTVTMVQLQTVAATADISERAGIDVGSVVTLSGPVAAVAAVPTPTISTALPGLAGEAHGPLSLAAGAVIVHTGTIAGAVT